jgi:hypothetical protein
LVHELKEANQILSLQTSFWTYELGNFKLWNFEMNLQTLKRSSEHFGKSYVKSTVKPVLHFDRIVTYRSIFFCVEVISSTLALRKQRNTLRFGTIYDWSGKLATSSAGHTARNEYARSQVKIWNLRRSCCILYFWKPAEEVGKLA